MVRVREGGEDEAAVKNSAQEEGRPPELNATSPSGSRAGLEQGWG